MKKVITEQTFNAIKILLKGGASQIEAAKYMDISLSTVSRIASAETFEEYRHTLAAMNIKIKEYKARKNHPEEPKIEPKIEPKQETKTEEKTENKPGSIASSYQINRMIELMKQQHEMLTLISNKLAFIVDELTN